MAFCVACGTQIIADAGFCGKCGRPVKRNPPAPAPVVDSAPESSPPPPVVAVSTGSGSSSTNIGRIAAIVALVGFLMPWISCQGMAGRESISGIQLANQAAPGLFMVPVSMLIALGLLLTKNTSFLDKMATAKALIGAGATSLVAMLYYYARFNGAGERDVFGLGGAMRQAFSIEFGAYLSLLGSIGVVVSGFLHRKEPD